MSEWTRGHQSRAGRADCACERREFHAKRVRAIGAMQCSTMSDKNRQSLMVAVAVVVGGDGTTS